MEFHNGESMGLFIDGSNLYSATQSLGFEIDFKKLLLNFQNKGRLLRAYYYTAILEGHENSPMRPFLDWLEYNGYTIVSKMAKEFQDADGQFKLKGNMDIELATDLIIMAEHLNHIFLFSGDGDFRRAVEVVQYKGVKVTAVSTVQSQPPMIADELRRQCDHFMDLEDIKIDIEKTNKN